MLIVYKKLGSVSRQVDSSRRRAVMCRYIDTSHHEGYIDSSHDRGSMNRYNDDSHLEERVLMHRYIIQISKGDVNFR